MQIFFLRRILQDLEKKPLRNFCLHSRSSFQPTGFLFIWNSPSGVFQKRRKMYGFVACHQKVSYGFVACRKRSLVSTQTWRRSWESLLFVIAKSRVVQMEKLWLTHDRRPGGLSRPWLCCGMAVNATQVHCCAMYNCTARQNIILSVKMTTLVDFGHVISTRLGNDYHCRERKT